MTDKSKYNTIEESAITALNRHEKFHIKAGGDRLTAKEYNTILHVYATMRERGWVKATRYFLTYYTDDIGLDGISTQGNISQSMYASMLLGQFNEDVLEARSELSCKLIASGLKEHPCPRMERD